MKPDIYAMVEAASEPEQPPAPSKLSPFKWRTQIDKSDREVEMARLEADIFQEHYDIVRLAAMFKDIDPAEENPPPDFIARFATPEEAHKAYRVARSGWMPQKDAPSGVGFAYKVAMGVIKGREELRARQQDAKPLNVTVVLNQPVIRGEDTHQYPVLEIEK